MGFCRKYKSWSLQFQVPVADFKFYIFFTFLQDSEAGLCIRCRQLPSSEHGPADNKQVISDICEFWYKIIQVNLLPLRLWLPLWPVRHLCIVHFGQIIFVKFLSAQWFEINFSYREWGFFYNHWALPPLKLWLVAFCGSIELCIFIYLSIYYPTMR